MEVLAECCPASQRQARRGAALGWKRGSTPTRAERPTCARSENADESCLDRAGARPIVQALATVESALPALANGDLKVQANEANAHMTTGRRCLRSVGRRRRSNRCERHTAIGSPTSRKANGLPKPNTGSRRPISPTAMRSVGAGWRRRHSEHWRNHRSSRTAHLPSSRSRNCDKRHAAAKASPTHCRPFFPQTGF